MSEGLMVDAREREKESEVFNGVEAVQEKRKKKRHNWLK